MKKRILSILLASFMLIAMLGTGCGEKDGDSDTPGQNQGGPAPSSGGSRTITIGTWYDIYYTSQHDDVYDNPSVEDTVRAQRELDNMRAVEAKHDIRLEYVNLTWNGIQESITTSIMAGRPDVEVYLVDLQFGIPAVLSNLAVSLESMGLEGTDVFTDNLVMRNLNLQQEGRTYLFKSSVLAGGLSVYPLGFNMDMIKEHNLENPQDLYDRGEWTWDAWQQMLVTLTDTERNIFGWSGYWTNMLHGLLNSNGATVASSPETTVNSAPTIEVLEFIYDIYNTWRVGRPWVEEDWEVNNRLYAQGLSGFWITADWIMQNFNENAAFEIGVVPWPIGPSGNQATNTHGPVSGNWYIIPRGVENPRQVYDVMYDWLNWYDYDIDLANDLEWAENQFITERNFNYAFMMELNLGFDIWEYMNLGDGFSMVEIMNGEKMASQYAEEVRPVIQDALDNFFG